MQHDVEVEVRYAETDQMGWVHHANYLIWFELARTGLCRLTGHTYAEIEELGYFLVVTRSELRYLTGARYGDTVTVGCDLVRQRGRGLRFEYAVERGGQTLVTGSTEHVWVDRQSGRPCRIPAELDQPFARIAAELLQPSR